VDRVDSDIAVLETEAGETVTFPASLLPPGAVEGTWLRLTLEPDPEGTKAAREKIAELRGELMEDDGEDFAL